MNLIILQDSDFVDGTFDIARLEGDTKNRALSLCGGKEGSTLYVGRLNGRMGTGVVTRRSEIFLELKASLTIEPPKPLPLTLVLALPRPRNFLKCLETAVILGIKKIYIVQSYLVEKDYWGSHYLSSEMIKIHVKTGLEQARDTMEPEINLKKRFKPFVEDELPDIARGTHGIVAHPYCSNPCPSLQSNPVTLAIGPDGGFIPYEVGLFKSIGFSEVSLGPRILRVEQAITALTSKLY
jgi:RsmE family RNA methyltransferase